MKNTKNILLIAFLFLTFLPFFSYSAALGSSGESQWQTVGKKKKGIDWADAESVRVFALSVINDVGINEHILEGHTLSEHRQGTSYFNTDNPERIRKTLISSLQTIHRMRIFRVENSLRPNGSFTSRLVIESLIPGEPPFGVIPPLNVHSRVMHPNGVRIVININEKDIVTAFPKMVK
jgi:hypothetical protein